MPRTKLIQKVAKIVLCMACVFVFHLGCAEKESASSVADRKSSATESVSGTADEKGSGANAEPDGRERETIILPGDDQILARVDGVPVTRYELEQFAKSTFQNSDVGKLEPDVRRKLLESMVIAKAIARKAETEMSAEDLAEVDKMVSAYREETLVKKYLASHAGPEPVTQEMVKEYYESHPEQFGAKKIRTFEMIFTPEKPTPKERDGIAEFLKAPEQQADWKAWADSLKRRGHPVAYREGEIDEKLLEEKLRNLIRPLKKGKTTQPTFLDGKAYVVRIVDEKNIPPKPLSLVNDSIRKLLAPVQLRKAIGKISGKVLETAKVVYGE